LAKDNLYPEIFKEFLISRDALWVYRETERIFRSEKSGIAPLVEYISASASNTVPITIMDKIVGNAAALLAVKSGAERVYSPLGSQLAAATLNRFRVESHLERVVPQILARNGIDICPMEKLSMGKEPDEFFRVIRQRFESVDRSC
jgi:hypothetical protein